MKLFIPMLLVAILYQGCLVMAISKVDGMKSGNCDCHFADSSYLSNVPCGVSTTSASLFMAYVDQIIRGQCSIAEPCGHVNDFSYKTDQTYDFIVVGGGVAGSVMAGRLSEQDDWRVLLLEAGPEEATATSIPAFAMSAVGSDLDWKFKTEPQRGACLGTGGVCTWPRGKMMGGTGALSAMMYMRGHMQLYNDWADDGCTGWSYDEVLPYFIRAENNRNPGLIESHYHGTKGPMTVQRFSHRPAIAEDVLAAAAELGYRSGDLNGHNQTGFAIAQMMVEEGRRASTARAYIRANNHKKNLDVKINSQVTRIIIDSVTKQAKAVEFRDSSGTIKQANAKKEIILTAGAVGSPHLLLLSGVGPEAVLKKFRIPIIRNLPVGYNLHNHVATKVKFFINDEDKQLLTKAAFELYLARKEGPLASTGLAQVTGFIRSKYSVTDMPDIQFLFDGFSAKCSITGDEKECTNGKETKTCGRRYIFISPTNILGRSTGYLTLKSANPFDPPSINPNYLSKDIDVKVLIDGVRFAIELSQTEAMKKWGMELDTTPAAGCEHLPFNSDDYWECQIRIHTDPGNHQAGSCRMGAVGDPRAVIDPELRVLGVPNLRVADASVFPLAPNSNPVSATVMVAEKGAEMITEAYSSDIPHFLFIHS